MRTVYLNGHFVPESEAKLSIYDLSVMQAAAAFEMTRSFHGVHFKLREHLERLVQSCGLLGIPVPLPIGEIEDRCDEVSHNYEGNRHGPGEEHRLLIVVSPGCAPMYRDLAGVIPHPFVYIADFPLRVTVQGFSTYFLEGVHCVTSPIQQVPDACVPASAKHRSRLHFHLAQQQAPPGTWPFLRLEGGLVTEAPGANLVYVKGGKIIRVIYNCLSGISMETVKELTGANWTPVAAIESADELWLTGTPFCMLPVVSLDGTPIGDGTIGPVYKETLAKWSALVGLDIAQQICDWDAQASPLWTPDAQRTRPA
jgi:branched-chain amino acid aminotransferase